MGKRYLSTKQIESCLERLADQWPPGLVLVLDGQDLVVVDRGRRDPVEVMRIRASRIPTQFLLPADSEVRDGQSV